VCIYSASTSKKKLFSGKKPGVVSCLLSANETGRGRQVAESRWCRAHQQRSRTCAAIHQRVPDDLPLRPLAELPNSRTSLDTTACVAGRPLPVASLTLSGERKPSCPSRSSRPWPRGKPSPIPADLAGCRRLRAGRLRTMSCRAGRPQGRHRCYR